MLFTVHRSQITDHSLQITDHSLQITVHTSQVTVHRSQFTDHRSQFTDQSSQITVHSSQITVHSLLLTALRSTPKKIVQFFISYRFLLYLPLEMSCVCPINFYLVDQKLFRNYNSFQELKEIFMFNLKKIKYGHSKN